MPIILIHGGAGVIERHHLSAQRLDCFMQALNDIVEKGQQCLLAGGSAVDVVAEAVVRLEDNPLFNAGKGAVLTAEGTHEMDASIMDGRDQSAGAVTCVSRIKNPVLAAKAVMQHSPHVCLAAQGAEQFAKKQGLTLVESGYFTTPERLAQLQAMQEKGAISLDHDGEHVMNVNPIDENNKYGTVGAVALDKDGNLAAATSTGGLTNKAVGRVGDTPIIGSGCYADDLCAVSTTGMGEMFMRGVIAYDVAARIRYGEQSLETAAQQAIAVRLAGLSGVGGLIAVDRQGNFAMPMNTSGMYRAVAQGDQPCIAQIFATD